MVRDQHVFLFSGDCDFDNGLCSGWTNAGNDQIDWSIDAYSTPSQYEFTGPQSDVYTIGKRQQLPTPVRDVSILA